MHLLDKYDLYAIMSTGTRVPAADQEVKKEMEVQAQFNKYLHKVEEDGHEKKSLVPHMKYFIVCFLLHFGRLAGYL